MSTATASLQNHFSRLSEEVTTRIMEYHYGSHIRGVLFVKYVRHFQHLGFVSSRGSSSCETYWPDDEGSKHCDEPAAVSVGMKKIQQILEIRRVSKLFARCLLDAFFESPVIFRFVSFGTPDTDKIIWFLPCQIEPKLAQHGTVIRVGHAKSGSGGQFVGNETDNHHVRTFMDLVLSKQTCSLSITDGDASLLANDINRAFIHNPNGLTVRGIQFHGDSQNRPAMLWSRMEDKTSLDVSKRARAHPLVDGGPWSLPILQSTPQNPRACGAGDGSLS